MNTLIIESLLISLEYVCDINNSIIPNQKFFYNQKVLASNQKVFWVYYFRYFTPNQKVFLIRKF